MNSQGYKWYTKEEVALWPSEHKKCRGCHGVLPFSCFHKQRQTIFGLSNYCKECRKPESKRKYATRSSEQLLWDAAKSRANKKGVPFSIKIEDIVIPEYCPVLGKLLDRSTAEEGRDRDLRPTMDRFIPELGYVPGNINIISNRANRIKSNATAEEIQAVAFWVQNMEVSNEN